jgi:DNA-directed RNA polymerase specialized sigma subunit
VEDRLGSNPYSTSAYTASVRTFEQLWQRFPAQTQLVLALHYYERATLSEVARITGIPEGRVSLVHTDAILLLRDFMRAGFEE